jgi:hypothetical protein
VLLGSPAVERLRAILSKFATEYVVIGYAMLEAENLKIALERYDGHPTLALLLAHQMMAIRHCLKRGKNGSVRPVARTVNPG